LDQKERQIIDELFGKLQQLDRQSPQRDAEAEEHIRRQVASLPASPYYMAQAILVQEQALGTLQSRVQELEREAAARPAAGGGFLGGLFGAPQPATRRAAGPTIQGPIPQQYLQQGQVGAPGSPWARPAGGGFLAGAMQTALGVAGGMMIANAITSAFDIGAAEAAEPTHEEPPADEPAEEAAADEASFDDFGGDAGGFEEPI